MYDPESELLPILAEKSIEDIEGETCEICESNHIAFCIFDDRGVEWCNERCLSCGHETEVEIYSRNTEDELYPDGVENNYI